MNSRYQLRKRTLTLTYEYTRNRKSSKAYTCTYKGCEKIPPFKDFTELIVHTEIEHSDDEDDDGSGNNPVCKYNNHEIEHSGDQDDVNSGKEYVCKHKNCAILAPFKDFSDLIAHTETVHSDTEDEDWESEGQVGTNQETVSTVEKRIFQDAWENFKRNSTAEAASRRYMEANSGHTCPVCNRVFERENERNLHVKLHAQMVHMCVHRPCGWTFQQFHELQWHYSTHHSSSSAAKESRNQELRNKIISTFSADLEIAGNNSPRFDENTEASQQNGEIPSFNANGIRRENADVPVAARTQNTKFACSVCKRVFKDSVGHSNHVRNHSSMKYKCMESSCGWEFVDFTQMKNHYFQMHKLNISLDVRYNYTILSNARKRCPICSRQLLASSPCPVLTYDYHVQNHDKMMFKCLHQSCGWMFENFLHVRSHYNMCHRQDVMDNEEGKYRVKKLGGSLMQSGNSNTDEKEPRSEFRETSCEAVVDVIKCKEESDADEVEFLSEIRDCTEPGNSSERASPDSMHNCEPAQIETIAKSCNPRETNGHQVQIHAKKTNINSTSKSSKECNKTHINRHSGLKYRCLHKKCVSMFKTFQQLKIHYQKAHREIIQQLHRRKYLCRIKGHVSLESGKKHNNYRESTMTRKRRTDEDLRFSPKKKRRISDRCLSESITRQKKSRSVKEKSPSVVKHNRSIVGLNLKDDDGGYRTRMECPRCTRELPRHVFKDHVKNHASLKFRCSYDRCKWMFANYSQLKVHYRYKHHCNVPKKVHNGAGSRFQSPMYTVMQCPECQRHLHKNQYDNHLLNHYQMTYRCSRANCGWLFESESKLNAHCENHPDMRYKCVYAKCGWVFETSNQLCGHYYYKHKPMSEVDASQHRIHSEYLVNSTREQRSSADNKTSRVRSHSEKPCSTQTRSLRERKRKRASSLETKSTQTPKTMTNDSRSFCSVISDPEGSDSNLPNISKSPLNVESSVRNLGNAMLNKPLAEQNTSCRVSTNQLNRRVTSKDLISTDERNSESQFPVIESTATGTNCLGTVTCLTLEDLSHCTAGSQTTAVKMELKEEPPVAKENNNEFFQMN